MPPFCAPQRTTNQRFNTFRSSGAHNNHATTSTNTVIVADSLATVPTPRPTAPTEAVNIEHRPPFHSSTHSQCKIISEFFALPTHIVTPINVNNLALALNSYPSQHIAQYLINGFNFGFDIGFFGPTTNTRPLVHAT